MGSLFFQAEDGIRDLVRSRGLGDVYKRQLLRMSESDRAYFVAFLKGSSAYQNNVEVQRNLDELSLIHI